MKKDMARVVAKEKGDKFYVPERPCMNGHGLRRTSDGSCVSCKIDAERKRVANNRAAYNARKSKERQPKLAQIAKKAQETRAQETSEKRALRLEKAKKNQRLWRLNNQGHEGSKKAKRKYKERNVGKTRANTIKRRLAKIQRTPAWLNADDFWLMEQAYDLAALRSKVFGFQWHVDHVFPLQGRRVSGLHTPLNLQVIPWIENVKKANKEPLDYGCDQ